MYKVTKRDCPMFGIGPYVCEFICDTASDISTLPTSISEGTGGRTAYDNQKCASGSIANVAENGAESKQYMLNNQDIWCPYSVASGSSDSVLEEAKAYTDSEIADLINGAPTTRDTLKEIADAMAENQTVVEALDAAIGTKANKTDIPTELPANGGNADTVNGHSVNADVPADAVFTDTIPDLSLYALKSNIPTKTSELENDSGFLTEHQDLSEYAKSTDVNAALTNKADASHTHDEYASKDLYSDTGINFGRQVDTDAGSYSTAEGSNTTASGNMSHAEGFHTTAKGHYSHAEGYHTTTIVSAIGSHAEGSNTKASNLYAHAEGSNTTASGPNSHAEGVNTTAEGLYSHAEGSGTKATGQASHADGIFTTASNIASYAIGKYNVEMINDRAVDLCEGTAFVIGNGTSPTALSNAFSVMFDGTVKAKSTITASTTADYAEFFEWFDENPDGEDRVGYFVTLDGDKIRIANSDDDYILGVVSGEPFVLGNGDCDTWNGMFLRDEFRRTIYEPAPKMEEILDDDGNPTGEYVEVEGEYEGTRPKLNPDYDHTKKYTSRFERKEWAPIGMLGVLAVRHDGTAKVNGYVTVAEGGIATACDKNAENSYRVIKANSDSVVEIIFR